MRRLFLLTLLCLATSLAIGADNEIILHNGQLRIGAPADWVILAHSPTGARSVVTFQIFGNEAEAGTKAGTNLTISTFSLKDAEASKAFAGQQTKRAAEGSTTREYEKWMIRKWQGEQDGMKYNIEDARTVNKALDAGILVRLAWPILPNNPDNYDEHMEFVLKMMLDSIALKNPETP